MHDIIVLHTQPADPAAFDAHYRSNHLGLVDKLPLLREFSWGHALNDAEECYVLARMAYADGDAAAESMASPEGGAAFADLGNFAEAGVRVLNIRRDDA